jgi:hypothetical protein
MYQRARKLHDLIGDPTQLLPLAEQQLEAYIVAMNSLALLDRPNAWIVIPITVENGSEVRQGVCCQISSAYKWFFSRGNGANYRNTSQSPNLRLANTTQKSSIWQIYNMSMPC